MVFNKHSVLGSFKSEIEYNCNFKFIKHQFTHNLQSAVELFIHCPKQLRDIMILDINWGWGNVLLTDMWCIGIVRYERIKRNKE